MTPFHLPSIRSRVASTAHPGRWAKLRRFICDFPLVSKQGLVPHIYSTCQFGASATVRERKRFQAKWIPVRVKKTRKKSPFNQGRRDRHEGRRVQKIAPH